MNSSAEEGERDLGKGRVPSPVVTSGGRVYERVGGRLEKPVKFLGSSGSKKVGVSEPSLVVDRRVACDLWTLRKVCERKQKLREEHSIVKVKNNNINSRDRVCIS